MLIQSNVVDGVCPIIAREPKGMLSAFQEVFQSGFQKMPVETR